MARPSWRGKAWAQINAEISCRLMGLPGSLRGAPCILGQLGGGPNPGKPPPDRGLPHHGLLFPRGLSERVPASTRREETGVPGTCRVRERWSEPSPPPRLHPQAVPRHASHGHWAGRTAVSVGSCPQDCAGTAGDRDGADMQGTYGRSRGAWGALRPQQTSRPLQEGRAKRVRLGPGSQPPAPPPLSAPHFPVSLLPGECGRHPSLPTSSAYPTPALGLGPGDQRRGGARTGWDSVPIPSRVGAAPRPREGHSAATA